VGANVAERSPCEIRRVNREAEDFQSGDMPLSLLLNVERSCGTIVNTV